MKPAVAPAKPPVPSESWAAALGRAQRAQLDAAAEARAAAEQAERTLREIFQREREVWWTAFKKAAATAIADYAAGRGLELLDLAVFADHANLFQVRAVPGLDHRISFAARLDPVDVPAPGLTVTTESPRGREMRPYTFAVDDEHHLVLALGSETFTAEAAVRIALEPWLQALAPVAPPRGDA